MPGRSCNRGVTLVPVSPLKGAVDSLSISFCKGLGAYQSLYNCMALTPVRNCKAVALVPFSQNNRHVALLPVSTCKGSEAFVAVSLHKEGMAWMPTSPHKKVRLWCSSVSIKKNHDFMLVSTHKEIMTFGASHFM